MTPIQSRRFFDALEASYQRAAARAAQARVNSASVIDADDGLDSEGYPLDQPREWSEDELKELRRRERACDDYGSL